jgi:hypothetical protein
MQPPAIGTPESSRNADDKLFVRDFCQDDETRALEPRFIILVLLSALIILVRAFK